MNAVRPGLMWYYNEQTARHCIPVLLGHGVKQRPIQKQWRTCVQRWGSRDALQLQGVIVAIENQAKGYYGLQYHPEVKHTEHGMETLKHFLFGIAKLKADWKLENILEEELEKLRRQVCLPFLWGISSRVMNNNVFACQLIINLGGCRASLAYPDLSHVV